MTIAELEEVWLAALADAGLPPDEFLVLPFEGRPRAEANLAVWHGPRPVEELEASELEPYSQSQLDTANARDNRQRHIIGLFVEGVDDMVVTALLRHELEHARQLTCTGFETAELARMAHTVIARRFPALRGSGVIYNLVPSEQDANAAGSTFARGRFGDPPDELVNGPDGVFFRQGLAAPAVETLSGRLIAFVALFGEEFEALLRDNGRDLTRVLDDVADGASRAWPTLRADATLTRILDQLRQAVPTPEDIARAGENPRDAWRGVAECISAAHARGVDILDAELG